MKASPGRLAAFARGPFEPVALAGFWALAVAQPLLDLVGRQPELIVAHDLGRGELVAFVALLALAPPLLLQAACWLTGRLWAPLGRGLAWLLAGTLATATALPALARLPVPPLVAGVGAGLLGLAVGVGLARSSALRTFAAFLAPAAVVVPLYFLFFSPARELLIGDGGESAVADMPGAGLPGASHLDVPVVLLILDELPLFSLLDGDHRIDAARFPSFARLAHDATWFRGASSVGTATSLAVPAILTGRRPQGPGPPTAHAYPQNLFRLLAGSHELRVIESVTKLCPREACEALEVETMSERWRSLAADLEIVYLHLVLPAAWRQGLPPIDQGWRDFGQSDAVGPDDDAWAPPSKSEVPHRFARFLASFEPSEGASGGRPVAHVLHLVLPHVPWCYLPSGRRYRFPGGWIVPEGLRGSDWLNQDWPTVLGWQRHLAQTVYADQLLGQLLDTLEARGLYDRAVVAVVADHGASFIAGQPRRAPTLDSYPEILSVPLFVKLPGQRAGSIDNRNVETIDLLPTVAAAAGVGVPWPVDGHDLFALEFPARPAKIAMHAGAGPLAGSHTYPADLLSHDAQLRRRLGLFGTGPAYPTLFLVGPHADLIGRLVTSVPAAPAVPVGVEIDDPGTLAEVDPTRDPLPALVSGSLVGTGAAVGLPLALALNGRIAASSYSFAAIDGTPRFSALLPESALVAGENRLSVWVQVATAGGLALAPTGAAAPVIFSWRDGAVLGADGQPIPWFGDTIGQAHRSGAELVGWVRRTAEREFPSRLLVFADGKLIGNLALRPGANELGVRPGKSKRFPFAIPLAADTPPGASLFAVAIVGGRAAHITLVDRQERDGDATARESTRPRQRHAAGPAPGAADR
jgi:hypothetical protein